MFCPRCGMQAAVEVRFCSRCGLPLDAAAELVESGGLPDWHTARADASGRLTPRQRGTRKGALIMVGGLLFFGITVLLTAFKEDFFILLPFAGLTLVFGLMRMLYGLLLEEDRADKQAAKRAADAAELAEFGARLQREKGHGAQLPPARTVPANAYMRPADTSDMVAPPSVAESTTRLLEEDEEGAARRLTPNKRK